jgi:hypothetical protein
MRVLLMTAIMFLAVDTTQFDCYFCAIAWHELSYHGRMLRHEATRYLSGYVDDAGTDRYRTRG